MGLARDDEYFWNALMVASNIENNPLAVEARDRALRGLRRPEAQGFLRSIVNSFQDVPMHSQSGIYLGAAPALKIDLARVHSVLRRIVIALYHEVNRIRVPVDYTVRIGWNQFEFPRAIRELGPSINAKWPGPYYIGQGEFSFTWLQTGSPPSGLWLMSFYESFCAFGYVRHPNAPAAEGGLAHGGDLL
jgi:hypothetical protein